MEVPTCTRREYARQLGIRLGPWCLLIAGACLPLLRVLADPLGSLPGSEAGDVYKHAWAFWHTPTQLLEGTWPFTSYLAAPDGGVLYDVMFLPALLMAPVTWLGNAVLATNVWVWLSLVAVGATTYLLARELVGSRIGAVTAALIVQTSPFLLGHALTSGVHERLAVWFFPLAILCLLRIVRGGGPGWSAVLVAGLFLTVSQSPTYGVFATVLLLVAVPATIPRPTRFAQRRAVRLLLATCVAAAVVMLASFLLQSWFVTHDRFLAGVSVQRANLGVGTNASSLQVADLSLLLDPGVVRAQSPLRMDDELYNLMYLGWVPVLAALGGVVLAWRRRRRRLLAVVGLGLFFGLLSLGPDLRAGAWTVPNPFYLFVAWLVPVYGTTEVVWQQIGVLVGLGACAIAVLVAAVPPRARALLAAALVAASIGERAWVLPIPAPVLAAAPARLSSIYDAAYGEGGLVEMPRIRPDHMLSRGFIFLAQTRHHMPIPAAINLGVARWDRYLPIMVGESPDWNQSAACLRDGGLRWVVVHQEWFGGAEEASVTVEGLRAAAGPPVAVEGDLLLFDLSRVRVRRRPADEVPCPVDLTR